MVSILKKTTLDPGCAKNYGPIIVSTVISKLVERYILHETGETEFNDAQFGFVSGKGTSTAVSLAHDVAAYSNSRGSSLFMCGLDAQAAFDGIPHPILFNKCQDVLSDHSWRLLYRWYSDIKVQIKWNGLSNPIEVAKGTRQGGLTSPYLFNCFYRDMIDELSSLEGGVTIGG
jgi:retron-type reverse transcriptase